MLFNLSSKSVCFTKSPISFLLANFAYIKLSVKFSHVNLLNISVVICTSWLVILSLISPMFASKALLVTNLLTFFYLYDTHPFY